MYKTITRGIFMIEYYVELIFLILLVVFILGINQIHDNNMIDIFIRMCINDERNRCQLLNY
jgi:hypothetical protein